jgi:HEAT repeat protein
MQQIQRQAAVMLSSLLGEAVPFDFLVAASKDADVEVRKLVCIALQGLTSHANPDWLIPLLDDRDSEVRHSAEEALIPYGNRVPLAPVLHALVERGVEFEDPLAQALGTFKEDFPRSVLESLTESHPEVAAVILGELGTAAPIDLLDTLLAVPTVPFSDSARQLRIEALEAAKKLKNPQLAPRLAAIMRDEQDVSRFYAAAALGAIGDPRYISEILELLPIAKTLDFSDVADGLSGFGEQMPVDAMVDFIQAYPSEGREEIDDLIGALQFAGTHTPYVFLVSYVQDLDRDPKARGAAAKVLASFAGAGLATSLQYDLALRVLIELLQSEGDPVFRAYTAYSLGLIKDRMALEPLSAVASASDENSFVAIHAAQGLYLLARAGLHAPVEMWKTVLDHTADMRRKFAIWALGRRDDASSQLLLDYFADPHLKELVHEQLLLHPPSNVFDLAKHHLATLAQADSDRLSQAAHKALTSLERTSN